MQSLLQYSIQLCYFQSLLNFSIVVYFITFHHLNATATVNKIIGTTTGSHYFSAREGLPMGREIREKGTRKSDFHKMDASHDFFKGNFQK